ncbi:hypothetical protein G9P44_001268 [Scheffersomyces stipitis]|nr:hypothetical protein G9P44_001268 [Scheffersomyces stipitis]
MSSRLVKFGLPDASAWHFPTLDTPVPSSPFTSEWLSSIFASSMNVTTPLTIAIVYFSSVHFINPIVKNRQLRKYYEKNPSEKKSGKEPKRVPAAPYAIARNPLFKVFVLLHNIFLCVYSVWTFIGMTASIVNTMGVFKGDILPTFYASLNRDTYTFKKFELFFQSVCDSKQGVFSRIISNDHHNLEVFGWWFYISKFYEVIDTIIILLKGRPSSLLQSYHHAGAMMCMWAGIRFQSPPIWIFVVFNSFIHSLMYFYFSLSCLHIRVPTLFKRVLTSMQITQFVVGGSIAVLHSFVWIIDTSEYVSEDNLRLISCISTPDQALPVLINVAYLAPLTALFAAFYIESYLKRK